jgi:hypothetical protein
VRLVIQQNSTEREGGNKGEKKKNYTDQCSTILWPLRTWIKTTQWEAWANSFLALAFQPPVVP